MALSDFVTLNRWVRLTAAAGTLALCGLLTASPAAAAVCKFAPFRQIDRDVGSEPQLLIDGTCTDPDYNEKTFVIDKTEQLTFQVPDGGPLIPYTQVTGHFPAMATSATLPPGVFISPKTAQQTYIWKFPAKEFWRNRSFQSQHPQGGGNVDNRLAFTNGAFSVNWTPGNSVASHRHHAAALKLAKAYANKLYGNTAKIYSYYWGCSGGGVVASGAAENTVGVWDGIQAHCIASKADGQYHVHYWQTFYALAIPQAKRDAIAAAAVRGGTGDIYAGLTAEEKAALDEYIAAGFPLVNAVPTKLIPLVDPIDIRMADPTYEDDFWSKPGYEGSAPTNYMKAAMVDGWATVTGISRNAAGEPTAIQFDPATVPPLGTIGDGYLEFYVYGPDGKTRLIDPTRAAGTSVANKRRFSLMGKFDTAKGTLALTEPNSPLLLNALKVGSKVWINNRFILTIAFYPRHSIVDRPSYEQYRNADGSPKYPQRKNIGVLDHSDYRTMGGRVTTGAIKTKVVVMVARKDPLVLINTNYAEAIKKTLGPAKADAMMRFYIEDNGIHSMAGGYKGIFYQSLIDMMAWAEKGVPPPPSTAYTIRKGQVISPDDAASRKGLQPVLNLTANGVTRATVGVGQPVQLAGKLEMPPKTGQIVQFGWSIDGKSDPLTVVGKPQPLVNVSRTISFDKPGTYVVRLSVDGQRDGQLHPANETIEQNYQEVRVVVQ